MTKPKISDVRKYREAIINSDKKHVTCDSLALEIGIYPEVISDCLRYFDPVLTMDYEFELRDLLPDMEKYLEDANKRNEIAKEKNRVIKERKAAKKAFASKYKNIGEFIYDKYASLGGIIDRGVKLNENELHELKELVNKELSNQKPRAHKKHHK